MVPRFTLSTSPRRSRRRALPALVLGAVLIAGLAASLVRAQEDPAAAGELSPLSPAECALSLAAWQAEGAPWPAEQLLFAGRMYARAELEPLLATLDDGTLRADVALAQQLVVYKLNLLRGVIPSSEAIDSALEAEMLFEFYAGGLPTGTEEIDAAALAEMAMLLPVLEAANDAGPCAEPVGE